LVSFHNYFLSFWNENMFWIDSSTWAQYVETLYNFIINVLTGQENKVRVDTSQAGEGALSVNIRAAGQEVRHSIQVCAQFIFNRLVGMLKCDI